MDPLGVGAEGRVLGVDAVDLAGRQARVDRQQLARLDLIRGDRHVGDLDAVLVLVEPHVVADADLGHDDADLARRRSGAPAAPGPAGRRPRFGIGQPDQADADLDLHRIDRQDSPRSRFLSAAASLAACGLLCVFVGGRLARQHAGPGPRRPAPSVSSGIRGRSVKIRTPRNPPVTASACGREKSCWKNSCGRLLSLGAARDQQARGQRDQERGHLADQAVADRQPREERPPPR